MHEAGVDAARATETDHQQGVAVVLTIKQQAVLNVFEITT
jgi:hypothetical protein